MSGGPKDGEAVVLLLAGINVGGKNKLPMAVVEGLLADMGATETVTYLQSGNVVTKSAPVDVGAKLAAAIKSTTQLDVPVFQRTGSELKQLIENNPFLERAKTPKNLHVAFLDAQPNPDWWDHAGTVHGDDRLALGDRAIYLSYEIDSRNSPLAGVLRKSPVKFTARNWSTIQKLKELCASET